MELYPNKKYLILFDGHCVICNGWVQFVAKRDLEGHFLFSTLENKHLIEKLSLMNLNTIHLITPKGEHLQKSKAVIEILSNLHRFRVLAIVLRWIPNRLADALYDVVARNRHLFFRKLKKCAVPNPKYKNRYII